MRNLLRAAVSMTMLVGLTSAALPAVSASPPSPAAVASTTDAPAPGDNPWHAATSGAAASDGAPPQVRATHMRTFGLTRSGMQAGLAAASPGSTQAAVVWLPTPAGTFQRFEVRDSPVMMPRLAAAHPEIRTYVGRGLDSDETVRIAMTPLGVTASVRGPSGSWYVDPLYHLDQSVYASYFGRHLPDTHGPFVEREMQDEIDAERAMGAAPAAGPVIGGTLRNFRLAVLTDPSFSDYWGASNELTGLVTNLNRVEQIYNDELDVHLLLVDNEPDAQLNTLAEAFEPNGPCGAAACFTQTQLAFCGGATLVRNKIVLGQIIGAENYDAGHVTLSNDGGGIASLGVVGSANKAQGCTGIPDADGDFYVVDYWAHEMGHNWNMNHSFGGDILNCSLGNRNDATAVEPGSGSSIMGYAGICQQDDLQPHSDPYFSQRSYQEAQTFMSANRSPVTEVQTASLRHFGGGVEVQTVMFSPLPRQTNPFTLRSSSFRIEIGGKKSVLIGKGGADYSDAGIQAAINDIDAFAGTVIVTDTSKDGFTVAYVGASANTDVSNLAITNLSCGGCYAAVDEIKHGGTTKDSFALRYGGSGDSRVLTLGSTYTIAGIEAALHDILLAGATATVAPFGGAGALNNTGFQVTFGGTLAGASPAGSHVATLTLTKLSTGTSGFVAKTAWGGPARNGGFVTTPTGNTPPVTTAPALYTIPYRTPFALTGGATDSDGDTLTYMWEQNDAGTGTPLTSSAKTSGPLFRQFGTRLDDSAYDPHAYGSCAPLGGDNGENCVTTNPTRVFPDLAQVLAGNTNAATGDCGAVPPNPKPLKPERIDCFSEWLPTSAYPGPMHFRLTTRDGHPGAGGISSADTTVDLAPGSGPFLVTSQDRSVSYRRGSTHKVTWNVARTDVAPIGVAKVDILFSSDGGKTFEPLLMNTPNDGSQAVTLPDARTTHARIEVRAVGNVFFAVNGSDFSLTKSGNFAQPASHRLL